MSIKLTIIGGGPGGYTAAFAAARAGCSVTLAEAARMGGVCLNNGCIPTKALRSSADALAMARRGAEFGIVGLEGAVVDMARVLARKERVCGILRDGLEKTCAGLKIRLARSRATLTSARETLLDDGSRVESDAVILAAGSRTLELPGLPYDGEHIRGSDHMLDAADVPRRLAIVGGGVIGCEMAFIYNELGSKVTLVEGRDRLLPMASVDSDISALLLREMKKRRIVVECGSTLRGVEVRDGVARGSIVPSSKGAGSGEKTLECDVVLVTAGRSPATRGLGLDAAGVAVDEQGWVRADEYMRTSVPGIWAVGDILGPQKSMLAHTAAMEALCAVEDILGRPRPMRYDHVPLAVFTAPEVGCVGLSEAQARERGHAVRGVVFQMRELGKAQAMGELAGICKLVEDSATGRLLGVHLAGAHATDILAEAVLALHQGLSARDLAGIVHAHPTMAEGMFEAALRLAQPER